MHQPKTLLFFALKTLLLLPLSFGAWYFFSLLLSVPVMHGLEWILGSFWGEWLQGVSRAGYQLNVLLTIPIAQNEASLALELNPLSYGYGLPFFVALVFAAPGEFETKVGQILLAWGLVLLPVQWLGLTILSLKTLVFDIHPAIAALIAPEPWQQEAIAIGYQFSSLVLPALSPLLVWVYFYRDFLQDLLPENHALQSNKDVDNS